MVGSVVLTAYTNVFPTPTTSGALQFMSRDNPLAIPIFFVTFFGTFVLTTLLRSSEYWWSLKLQGRRLFIRLTGGEKKWLDKFCRSLRRQRVPR